MRGILASMAACSLLLVAAVSAQKPSPDKPNGNEHRSDSSVYAELGKAPEKARNRVNPLQNDPEAFAAGAILFEQHCAECHGNGAEGSRKAPSLKASEVQNATPGALFWVITNGVVRKKMPVWSKLPEAQRWQLVRYIKSLGAAGQAPAVESPAPRP